MLVPQIAVSIEEVDLLEISDDDHYSVMGKGNSVADDMKIYREGFATKIRESCADRERTIVVKSPRPWG